MILVGKTGISSSCFICHFDGLFLQLIEKEYLQRVPSRLSMEMFSFGFFVISFLMMYLQVTSGLLNVFKRENNRLETKQNISHFTRIIVKITKNEEFYLGQKQLSNC